MKILTYTDGHIAAVLSERDLRSLLDDMRAGRVAALHRRVEGLPSLTVIGETDARHYRHEAEAPLRWIHPGYAEYGEL